MACPRRRGMALALRSEAEEWTMRARGVVAIWAVGAIVGLLLAGCATAPKKEETRLVWPPPPLKGRIEFVRSIISDKDLERDTTFSERLVAFLAGEKPEP